MRAARCANFNPAVSVALDLSGKMDWKTVGIYCAMQIVTGISAGLSAAGMLLAVKNVARSPGLGWWEAMLAEVLYTFVLCFVVLTVATTRTGVPPSLMAPTQTGIFASMR